MTTKTLYIMQTITTITQNQLKAYKYGIVMPYKKETHDHVSVLVRTK